MRAFRWATGTVLVAVTLWCLAVLSIYLFGGLDESRSADAIIVLGAAQYDGRPSPVLRSRVDHAIDLYQRELAEYIIFTGGVGVGDTVSEAEVSRRYAIAQGVPAGRILIERDGLSSGESMREAVRLMGRHGIDSVLLVSDPFHMLRLRLLARRLGIRAYSSPTRTSPIARGSPDEWRQIVRESFILPSLLAGDRIDEITAVVDPPR